jgi:two-component system sensor histidine kinase EvgS
MKQYLCSLIIVGFVCLLFSCNTTDVLSDEERAWLNDHPNLTVSIYITNPPFQFMNEEGVVDGLFYDYLLEIEDKLDYKFQRTYTSNWSENLQRIRNKEFDIIIEVQQTPERSEYLNFTKPIIEHPHVIIANSEVKGNLRLKDLKGKKVALVKDYAVYDHLIERHPNQECIFFDDDLSCLRAVSTGQADAYISQQATATYSIKKEGISNLKIVGKSGFTNVLGIATRKDYVELNTIIQKAIDAIPNYKRKEIEDKWLLNEDRPMYERPRFWAGLLTVVIALLLVVTIFVFVLRWQIKSKTKELQEAKEKAIESDILKTAFLSNMSHEIRTPLNSILGFSQMISNQKLSPEKYQEYSKLIQNSGRQLLRLITDIIDISKIQSNQLVVEMTKIDVNELMQELYVEFLNSKFLNDKPLLRLEIEIPDTYPQYIMTDPIRFKQVIGNLLTNALKYSDTGCISFGYERLSETNELHFFVKDEGIGIAPEDQEFIFDRFRQSSKINFVEGTGLGLSITKGLVSLLGGELDFKSKLNVGSTFFFKLQYEYFSEPQIVTNPVQEDINAFDFSNYSCFIAEDDLSSFILLQEILSPTGLKIEHANDGLELLSLMEKQIPDLILLDINMPNMDGFECIQIIRKKHTDLPIIAQTAYAMGSEKKRALEAGFSDYLFKPIQRKNLFEMMYKHLNK